MSSHSLPTYLNDHLAGSVAALEMIDHIMAANKATPLHAFLAAMKIEIDADQETLKQIVAAVGAKESATRQAMAWTIEKVGWVKLEISDLHEYGLLQALEALVLGITGKRGLWEVLASLQSTTPALQDFHFATLIERATKQAGSVNDRRLVVGLEVLGASLNAASV
jgi:hypothetical protein